MEKFTSLDSVFKTAWNLLYRAAISRNDAMRTPVLATVAEGYPHQRTIVLRRVDPQEQQLYFFSDARAPKIDHLQQNTNCNVLFWDPRKKVQIEIQAKGQVLQQTSITQQFWKKINIGGRTSYAALQAPGTAIEKEQAYLPKDWGSNMDIQDSEFAFKHFAVLELVAHQLDILHLHPAGHQRCLFIKGNDKVWEKQWIVP